MFSGSGVQVQTDYTAKPNFFCAGRNLWDWSFRYLPAHPRSLQGNPACCLNSCALCTAPRACPEGGPAGCLRLGAIQTPCACQSIRAVPPEHLRTRRRPGGLSPK